VETFAFKKMPLDLSGINIDGDRINLLSINEGYTEEIFKEFTPEITRYMLPKPAAVIDETKAFISASLEGMKAGRELVLVITANESGEFLGCCGLHGRCNPNTPEFGIWLKHSAHGNAYGLEAIKTLGRWAVENIEFDYAIYPVDRANIPSRKIAESMGGVVIEEKQVKTMREDILDELVYRIEPEALS
jgi:[ribosomal protein S5]-alanine N-acetyltransferase